MKDLKMPISLENFDEENTQPPLLTSPRSLEACKAQGILPEELIKRGLAYFKMQDPTASNSLLLKRMEHNESRRREHLKIVTNERNKLCDRTRNGSTMSSRSDRKVGESSTVKPHEHRGEDLISKERMQLEKIAKRQQQDIANLMEHEVKMAQIREENESRLLIEEAKREELKKNHQAKLRALEKEKARKLEEKARIAEMKEKEHQEMMQRIKLVEEAEKLKRQEDEIAMKKKVKEKEEELKRKRIELEEKSIAARKAEIDKIMEKELQAEKREAERRVKREQERARHEKIMSENRRIVEERLARAKENSKDILEKKRHDFEKLQEEVAERQRSFEEEQRRRLEAQNFAAREKQIEINRVKKERDALEETRKLRLLEKERETNERIEELKRDQESRKRRQQRESAEEARRKEFVRKQAEKLDADRRESIRKTMDSKNRNLQQVRMQKEEEIRMKAEEARLREEDRKNALERNKRILEYQKRKVLEKIESDNARIEGMTAKQKQIRERKKAVAIENKKRKDLILEKFEKLKLSRKVDVKELSSLGIDIKPKDNMEATVSRPNIARPKSAAAPSTHRHTVKTVADIPTHSHKEITNKVTVKRPISAGPLKSRQTEGALPQMRPNKTSGKKKKKQVRAVSKEEANVIITNLRRKQNLQLLRVLEEEQEAEQKREAMIKTVHDNGEKNRLEKIFGIERSRASERIMQLTDEHEVVLAAKLSELGLIR